MRNNRGNLGDRWQLARRARTIYLDGALRSAISSEMSVEPLERELSSAMLASADIMVQSADQKEAVVLVSAALPALVAREVRRELDEIQGCASAVQQAENEDQIRCRPSVIALPDEVTSDTVAWFEHALGGYPTYGIGHFWRTYCRHLCGSGEAEMTALLAAELGYASEVAAIRERQPRIWDSLRRPHDRLQRMFQAGAVVVASEDALTDWLAGGLTAAFVHPDFFRVGPDEYPRLAEEARPRFAVLGGSDKDDCICLHAVDHLRWVVGLMQRFPTLWGVDHAPLPEKLAAFLAWQRQTPAEIRFEEALSIERDGYGPDDDLDGMHSESILARLAIPGSFVAWSARERRFRVRPDVSILVTSSLAE